MLHPEPRAAALETSAGQSEDPEAMFALKGPLGTWGNFTSTR